jgi:LmbE family N-acetylglucosaminyl deacetylase
MTRPRPATERLLDPAELGRRVTVLSPHLDDGVFSLGATIARAARGRARVEVLTVFAGDPESSRPAGDWDRRAGFTTEGEAAAARRREDRRACSLLSATPVWQTFPDEQYSDERDDALLAGALEEALWGTETVLVPAFPLTHADHLHLAEVVLGAGLFAGRIALYVEQPYALWDEAPRLPDRLREIVPESVSWSPVHVGYRDLGLKLLACRAYATQLALIPHRIVWPMSRYEKARDVLALLERA